MTNTRICIKKKTAGILVLSILLVVGYVFLSSAARTARVNMNSRASEKATGTPMRQQQISTLILKDLKLKAQGVLKTAGYEVRDRIMQEESAIDEARKALIDQTKQSMKTLSDYGDLLRDAKLNSEDDLVVAQKNEVSSKRELDQAQGVLLIAEENARLSQKEVASQEVEVNKAKELVERTNEIQSSTDETLLLELRAEVLVLGENYDKSMAEVNNALGHLISQLNQDIFPFVPRAILAEWSLELVDVKDNANIALILQSVNRIESSRLYGLLLFLSTTTRSVHENLKEKLSVAFEKKIMYEGKADMLKTAEMESAGRDMEVFKVAVRLGYDKALSDLEKSRKRYAELLTDENTLRSPVETLKKSYEKILKETLRKQQKRDVFITSIMEVTRVRTDISKIELTTGNDIDTPLAGLIDKAEMSLELEEIGKMNKSIMSEEIDKINDLLWKVSESYESLNAALENTL